MSLNPHPAPPTVLLVDDDPGVLKLLELTFRKQGYGTVTAANGLEALRRIEETAPDLIITDVAMPELDGFTLCSRVRSDQRLQAVPFIFLSAKGGADDRVIGLDLGADDYVVKPFERRELLAKARTLIRRSHIYRDQLDVNAAHSGTSARRRQEKRPRVLIVDDDPALRTLVSFSMGKAGFNAATAADGEAALAEVRRRRPDLIISDVLMPVMDGLELRQELMRRWQYASIPFLFLTARDQPEDILTGLRLGVDDYLTKPINVQVLVQKARNLLERYRASAAHYRDELDEAAHRVAVYFEPEVPCAPGMAFAHRCEPLEVRGGDYYDYIPLDDGSFAVVVGDVMGKKWGAWFFSVAYIAYMRSVIRSTGMANRSPGAIVRHINQLLWEDLKISEVFTTILVGIVDPRARTATCASAGHPAPIHYRAATGEATVGSEGGMILGVRPDEDYPDATVTLAPGDVLVCYTDGMTEATNADGEMFGEERLVGAVRAAGGRQADGVVAGIFDSMEEFVGDADPEDDRTIVVVRADG